jgi:hypothetical protein
MPARDISTRQLDLLLLRTLLDQWLRSHENLKSATLGNCIVLMSDKTELKKLLKNWTKIYPKYARVSVRENLNYVALEAGAQMRNQQGRKPVKFEDLDEDDPDAM